MLHYKILISSNIIYGKSLEIQISMYITPRVCRKLLNLDNSRTTNFLDKVFTYDFLSF